MTVYKCCSLPTTINLLTPFSKLITPFSKLITPSRKPQHP